MYTDGGMITAQFRDHARLRSRSRLYQNLLLRSLPFDLPGEVVSDWLLVCAGHHRWGNNLRSSCRYLSVYARSQSVGRYRLRRGALCEHDGLLLCELWDQAR